MIILISAACGSSNGVASPENLPPPEITLLAATLTPSATATLLPTVTASATATFTPTATPQWLLNEAGHATVPILLYHHISDEEPFSQYYVGIENFKAQMNSLQDWGYTSISMSLFLEALTEGAELPPRPVVITFDDGHTSVYENAFPLMQELGFIGINYVVANRLESENFMGVDQLREMQEAGWEVGSHSMSHSDLTEIHNMAQHEILDSRLKLEEALDTNVDTFSYPFGASDSFLLDLVEESGYRAGIRLSAHWEHSIDTLFFISRIEVYGGNDLAGFAELLPWSGPLEAGE